MSTPSAATKDQIVKRWIVFFIGMFLMGTGIALSIKATIGVSPMSSITNLLILIFPNISLGTFSFLVNFLFFVAEFIVAPKTWHPIKILTQLVPTFICSVFIDINMALVSSITPESYLMKVAVLLLGCLVFGLSLALMVSADATLQPSEAFISVVAERTGRAWGNVRTAVDISLVIIAVIASLIVFQALTTVREGTVVAAILVGQSSRWFAPLTDRIFSSQKAAAPVSQN
ncbi:MAG: peptide ABC transporter ATP-binding protein [Clostridiales bacterium]|nr:peptide ABC transporter ATP-binding protein [Clostridiales bacterium]